jgi:hypothetical protein
LGRAATTHDELLDKDPERALRSFQPFKGSFHTGLVLFGCLIDRCLGFYSPAFDRVAKNMSEVNQSSLQVTRSLPIIRRGRNRVNKMLEEFDEGNDLGLAGVKERLDKRIESCNKA